VNEAIKSLGDGGDATSATKTLEDYLSTGPCAEGNIGAPELLKRRADGNFDLGLSLFKLGESFGRRFGDEELDGGLNEQDKALRDAQINCALRVLGAIAADESVPLELRARARYLEGNLNFLDGQYKEAVKSYDEALKLSPGQGTDGGDRLGRDAAWNRAIALRRIEDKKDAGQDASNDASNDAANDAGKDGAGDSGNDSGNDEGGKDSGKDGGNEGGNGGNDGGQDSGPDGGDDAAQPPPPHEQDSGTPPPRADEDERILQQLENAPTVQQEAAKKMAAHRKVRGMADK
jgi:tetratricopeptide (TPR) repeat protein